MQSRKKDFARLQLSELSPVAYNPNVLSDDAMKKLVASVRENSATLANWDKKSGYRLATTITVNVNGNRVIGGWHRVKALRQLGQDWIHCSDITWIDVAPESAREKALNVQLNRADAQGKMDQAKLDLILSEVKIETPELFLSLEMDDLSEPEKTETENADCDAAPELPETPVSVPGAIYRLGEHRMLCGDCTDAETVFRLMGKGSADAVFTDPPYNMDYKSKALGGIKNDALGEAAFVRLILSSMANMAKTLRDGGAFYICMSGAEYATVANQLRKIGLAHRLIVWIKNHVGLGNQDYRPQFEFILYGITGAKKERLWRGGRRESDVWEFDADRAVNAVETIGGGMELEFGNGVETTRVLLDSRVGGTVVGFDGTVSDLWRFSRERGNYAHPTQKPVALVERALRNSTKRGAVVFDPFSGSGTTLIAAERLKRAARCMELDPRYCDVIRRRWATMVFGDGCDWEKETPIFEGN